MHSWNSDMTMKRMKRAQKVCMEFKSTSSPENAPDKLASEYEFRKSNLKSGLLGGKESGDTH
jgi:hypothetical protein